MTAADSAAKALADACVRKEDALAAQAIAQNNYYGAVGEDWADPKKKADYEAADAELSAAEKAYEAALKQYRLEVSK